MVGAWPAVKTERKGIMKMSWLVRLVPSAIRKTIYSAVMAEIEEQTRVEAIIGHGLKGVDFAIKATTKGVSDERMVQICEGCEIGGKAFTHLSQSIHPNSEEGRAISDSEAVVIKNDISESMKKLIQQESIDEIVAKVGDKVKGYLYLK